MRKRATSRRGTRGNSKRGRRRTRNVRSKRIGGRDYKGSPTRKSKIPDTTHISYDEFGSWFDPSNLTDDTLDDLAELYNDSSNYSQFSNKLFNEFNPTQIPPMLRNQGILFNKDRDRSWEYTTKKYPYIKLYRPPNPVTIR